MSYWIALGGEFLCPGVVSDAEAMALADQDDRPRGSEGPCDLHVYRYGDESETYISAGGSLRDRGSNVDMDAIAAWFVRVCSSPLIAWAWLELEVGGRFVRGYYYDGDHYAIAAPVAFLHLPSDD